MSLNPACVRERRVNNITCC